MHCYLCGRELWGYPMTFTVGGVKRELHASVLRNCALEYENKEQKKSPKSDEREG